jgi:nucleoside-diphosphate-sugar epimerase
VKVFLTGGTGLVGSHAAASLVAAGHEVVALCRPGASRSWLEELGCGIVEGDVRAEPEVLASNMRGCTHLVHAAALVYSGASWQDVRATNALGTRSVFLGAADAGLSHAVHVSSVSVYGGVAEAVDEETPIDGELPRRNLYALSKREAEAEVRRVEEEWGLAVTVLRPASVYGERDRLLSFKVARIVRWPVAFLLGSGGNTIPTVYAGNVGHAVLLAVRSGVAGKTYDVGMDHPLTQRELLEGIAEGMGLSPRLWSVPEGLARVVAAVSDRLGATAPGASGLPLGRAVRLALGENPYGSRRIREELGWRPPHRHHDALRRTGRWLSGVNA